MSIFMFDVLGTEPNSNWLSVPGAICWDIQRDMRKCPGGLPAIAHAPCRGWSRLAHMSHADKDELQLAEFALHHVKRHGGIFEHPSGSKIWRRFGLNFAPGANSHDGWTLAMPQSWAGHMAQKETWFYIVGASPGQCPLIPFDMGRVDFVLAASRRNSRMRHLPKRLRSTTPMPMALYLRSILKTIWQNNYG